MVFWYFCDFYRMIHLQVGVTIRPSSSGLTKICTFTPFYIVMNTSDVNMLVAEAKEEEEWIELPPKSVNRKKYYQISFNELTRRLYYQNWQ